MPMPHRTFAQVAKRRLTGTEGSERVRVITVAPRPSCPTIATARTPTCASGSRASSTARASGRRSPTATRCRCVARAQPRSRSSGRPTPASRRCCRALSEIQIRTGDYAFTTLRPVPALTRIGGVLVQLVEIPGLIEGAHEDRGGGKALLGVLRNADAIVWCQAVTAPLDQLRVVRGEVAAAGIEKPGLLAATKWDDAAAGRRRPTRCRGRSRSTSCRCPCSTTRASSVCARRSGRSPA